MSLFLRHTKCLRYLSRTNGSIRAVSLLSSSRNSSVALCNKGNYFNTVRWSRQYSTPAAGLQPLLSRLDDEVRRFGRLTRRDIDELLLAVRTHNLTSAQSLLVIRCFGELIPEEQPERRTELVQKVWSALNERNVPLDVSHYNALLRVYLENEHAFSPAEFLEQLEKKGIQPNRVTYQRLMWRYCQAGDVDGATRVLERMRELGLPVSEPVLNALVMGHAYHGDTAGARAVMETMAGAGLQPGGRTYALLACGHARSGEVDAAREVVKMAAEKDVYLTDKDLMDIVESLALGGHNDALDGFLQMMRRGAGYNSDALPLILRLINLGLDDAAIQVHKTLADIKVDAKDRSPYIGAFFVRQLIKASRPAEQLVQTCRRLQAEGLVPNALLIATEAALQQGDSHRAKTLINELQKDGLPVRQHYYWPILVAAAKANDEEAIMDTLRAMEAAQLPPNLETLGEYVVPYLRTKHNTDTVILKLQGANITTARAARAVLVDLLASGEATEAAKVALQFQPKGFVANVARPLLACLMKTKDIDSFVKVLHAILETTGSREEEDVQDGEKEQFQRTDVSGIVLSAVKLLKDVSSIESLLSALESRGIGVSSQYAEKIEGFLGERMTPTVSERLSRLSSAELAPVAAERLARPRSAPADVWRLEKLLARAKEQGNPTASLSRQIISAYIQSEDEAKLTAFVDQLESEQFVPSAPILAQLVEFYSERDLERALRYKRQLEEREPDFVLNKHKVLKLARALVTAGRTEEALQLVRAPRQDKDEGHSFLNNSLAWQILNHLAEHQEKKDVSAMLEALLSNKFVEVSNTLLGPLVKSHLLRDDVEGAITEMERCCELYKCTPWKGEVLRRLIVAEDAERLQRVTDASTAAHGEANSLHDLSLALVETGRLRQARRVLATPGLRARHARLSNAAHRYMQEGKTECLEGLMEATKELSHINRSDIFYNLLVSYCRAEATDKALGLWTQLQEQDEVPTEAFLTHLGTYLRERNLPIPFVVPRSQKKPKDNTETAKVETAKAETAKAKTAKAKTPKAETARVEEEPGLNKDVKAAIAAADPEKIISLLESATPADGLRSNTYGHAIDKLLNLGRVEDAFKMAELSLQRGTVPSLKSLRHLLAVCADRGDEASIERLATKLSDKHKAGLQINSKVSRARVNGADGARHLRALLAAVEGAGGADEARAALEAFPRGAGLMAALARDDQRDLCEQIMEATLKKGHPLAAQLIWQEMLISGQHEAARALWERAVQHADGLLFKRVLQVARERTDPRLVNTLLEYVRKHKGTTEPTLKYVNARLQEIEKDLAGKSETVAAAAEA